MCPRSPSIELAQVKATLKGYTDDDISSPKYTQRPYVRPPFVQAECSKKGLHVTGRLLLLYGPAGGVTCLSLHSHQWATTSRPGFGRSPRLRFSMLPSRYPGGLLFFVLPQSAFLTRQMQCFGRNIHCVFACVHPGGP